MRNRLIRIGTQEMTEGYAPARSAGRVRYGQANYGETQPTLRTEQDGDFHRPRDGSGTKRLRGGYGRKGDLIKVIRKNGTTAVFVADRGEQYSKAEFPTEKVYGNTDGAELRLITCDGYDPKTGEFDDNYVVYAKLVA